jgi:hypothetical protein
VAAAGAVTVIVGAIVAVANLPSRLGLTHTQREKHGVVALAPVSLSHQTLAGFSSELGAQHAAAFRPHDQPQLRLVLAATGEGVLLAQADTTGDDSQSDPVPPDGGSSVNGTDESLGQPEPAPDSDGHGETNPTTVTTTTPTPSPTVPTTPTTPTTPTGTTSTTGTETTPAPPGPVEPPLPSSTESKVQSPEVPIVIPNKVTPEDFQEVAQAVQDDTGLAGAGCAEDLSGCPGLIAMIGAAMTDSSGAPVSVAVAAKRLERALPQMHRVQGPSGPTVDGVEVDATVHARDLKGATIFIKWQLIERGAGKLQLYGNWLSANSVYRLIPPSDDVDTDLPLWVPRPPRSGSYGIRLLVYVDGTRFMHKDVPLKL